MGCCQPLTTFHTYEKSDYPNPTIKRFLLSASDFICLKQSSISEDYTPEGLISRSGHSLIQKALHKPSNTWRVIKTFRIPSDTLLFQTLIQEISILKKLDHPGILKIFEVFKTPTKLQIVTELCTGGELFERIQELKKFSENAAARCIKEIASALMHCHRQGVVHRNLKPENILYESKEKDSRVKLIDFSTSILDAETEKELEINHFLAPEAFAGKSCEKSDVWSLGAILYVLLSGFPPFRGKNYDEVRHNVENSKLEFSHQNWKNVSDDAKNLVSRMLSKNLKTRPGIEEVFHDYWVKIRADDLIPDKQIQESSLKSLGSFKAESHLQKAVFTFIVSQRLNISVFQDLKDVFSAIDKDGDGFLSTEELRHALHNSQLDLDAEKIIDECDSSGNGLINYSEFLMATVDKQAAYNTERLKQVFQAFDLNGDGKIDLQELQTALGLDGTRNSIIGQIFKETDVNGDGEIDFDEFFQQVGRF